MRYYKKQSADYSDVYIPRDNAQTVAIENAASHEEFRTAEEIHARAQREDPNIRLERVQGHCDWQVEKRKLWVMEDR